MVFLCLLIAAAPADLRSTIDSYLGAIERPASAQQWKALGPDAVPILEEIVAGNQLPTRRAKAVAGLAVLSPDAPALLSGYALDEKQHFSVRMAAVSGLSRLSADASLLQPVLKARDPRVSAAAARLLVERSPSSCAAVRARAGKDEHFERALAGCRR